MSKIITSIPVTVITGFLGSGKTTLISSLLKNPDMKNTALIINEFGEVGIDHSLVERAEENVIEIQNGCICCTIRGDLLNTLKGLAAKMWQGSVPVFDKVIIETTGLANPIPIVHTLMTAPELYDIYTLDGVITMVDAANGEHTLNTHSESVKQAALAERILISKTDIVEKSQVEALESRLYDINPGVKIIQATNGNVSVAELFGLGTYDPFTKSNDVVKWLNHEVYGHHHHHHHHDINRHSDKINAFSMMYDTPVDMGSFSFFLQLIAGQMGENLLRVKGIVNVEGENEPAVIQGVQHIFHPIKWLNKWPDEDKTTRLVFITNDIPKSTIQGIFNALMGVADEAPTSVA